MSALNKMMGFLGLVDTDEEAVANTPATRTTPPRATRDKTGVTVLGSAPSIQSTYSSSVASQPALIDDAASYNIITLQPRSYSEARKVGEYYREGNPVIINLDDMEEGERKRLVDFASGLVFGLHGRIERISLKVFLLSPANVSVSNEEKTAAQATFFNQS
jgi:cell division inhibitor SepF|uniref:cell division protein SepF n=1 Tax=Candidatus Planktophila sp. TaxID=2175601 RepID=UPI0040493AF6